MPGGRVFLDTNIFVYVFDRRDAGKQRVARGLVSASLQSVAAFTSFQVVQEFLNVSLKSSTQGFEEQDAMRFVREVFAKMTLVSPSLNLFEAGLKLKERYQFHWYDSLIVAAAVEAGCEVLYTEDLQHGQRIGDLRVVNPFL